MGTVPNSVQTGVWTELGTVPDSVHPGGPLQQIPPLGIAGRQPGGFQVVGAGSRLLALALEQVGPDRREAAEQDAEDLRRKAAQQVLQLRLGQGQAIAAVSMTARTSTSPAPACTSGIIAAISSARSSEATSTR